MRNYYKYLLLISLLFFCDCRSMSGGGNQMGGGGGGGPMGNGGGSGGCNGGSCSAGASEFEDGQFSNEQGPPVLSPEGLEQQDGGHGAQFSNSEIISIPSGVRPSEVRLPEGSAPFPSEEVETKSEEGTGNIEEKATVPVGGEFVGLFDLNQNPATWSQGTRQNVRLNTTPETPLTRHAPSATPRAH